MAVYIPVGHGTEDLYKPRKTVPDGCSVTVIETCGGAHLWTAKESETFEYTQLTDFFRKHPEQRHIFSNPKENAHILNDIFGSVAIYGPGEKYPNIKYNLFLDWPKDIRYSGLIPLDTFVSPDFTTKNIITRLLTESSVPADPAKGLYPLISDVSYEKNDIWLRNKLEIYKHSVYPSPQDFIRYFSDIEGRKTLFRNAGQKSVANSDAANAAAAYNWEAKRTFRFHMQEEPEYEGYIAVYLETLLAKFPGHYIHIVCRGTEETRLPSNIYNPNPNMNHTKEEIFTKRIPFMSANQKRKGILNIEQSRKNKQKSKFNIRSTKTVNNIMLAGLKKSLAQNELLSKVKRTRRTRKLNRIE